MSKSGKYYLPQIKMPFDQIFNELNNENIKYYELQLNPNILIPSQPFVFSHEVENFNNKPNIDPIFTDKDLKIIDGHNRCINCINNNKQINVIKLDADFLSACRVLNKIQDLFDHKKEVAEDKENNMEFLERIEQTKVDPDQPKEEPVKIIAYRKEKINPKSIIGNFFSLQPLADASKFEIEFDNLLDVKSLGLDFKDGQNPVDMLAKTWFPHLDFEKLAVENNTDSIKLKNRAVADKARKMNFDGIQYSDKLIQGL